MSRIGRLPIAVPSGVEVTIEGPRIAVSGPRGKLERALPAEMRVERQDGTIVVSRPSDAKHHRELHGLTRTLVANMVTGVGYRAQKIGERLQLSLGYSHPVEIEPPPGISFELENPTRLAVVGIDKELVGQVAAAVRASRKPEPYKGKGVRYAGEQVRRKAGKAGKIGAKK